MWACMAVTLASPTRVVMAEAGAPAEAVEGGNRAQSERMVLVHPVRRLRREWGCVVLTAAIRGSTAPPLRSPRQLLLLNVADHWTRSEEDGGIVAGALVGFQTGRDVDLTNSFELVCKADGDGSVSMDVDFLQSQFALCACLAAAGPAWTLVTRRVQSARCTPTCSSWAGTPSRARSKCSTSSCTRRCAPGARARRCRCSHTGG